MSLTQLVHDDESPYKVDMNEADTKNILLATSKEAISSSPKPIEERQTPAIKIKQSDLLPLPNQNRRDSRLLDPKADFDLDNAFEDFVVNSIQGRSEKNSSKSTGLQDKSSIKRKLIGIKDTEPKAAEEQFELQ